jgi:hypothetical protein
MKEVEAPKTKRSLNNATQDTCPWSSTANDKDTARIERAARTRQKPPPSYLGAAGSGAPKSDSGNVLKKDAPTPELDSLQDTLPSVQKSEGAPTHHSETNDGSAKDEEEERREIIQHCLAEGLSEERIMEVLDEWHSEKMCRGYSEKTSTLQPRDFEASGKAQSSSLAASRQAKAKKALSFGPSDKEIVDVLQDYSKENLTPPITPPQNLTLAAKRALSKEASEASLGSFDSGRSRAAFLHSRSQADAAKSKNRGGAGIF